MLQFSKLLLRLYFLVQFIFSFSAKEILHPPHVLCHLFYEIVISAAVRIFPDDPVQSFRNSVPFYSHKTQTHCNIACQNSFYQGKVEPIIVCYIDLFSDFNSDGLNLDIVFLSVYVHCQLAKPSRTISLALVLTSVTYCLRIDSFVYLLYFSYTDNRFHLSQKVSECKTEDVTHSLALKFSRVTKKARLD